MLLYLYNGSLPRQGYSGDDKSIQVCEMKGRLTIDAMCRGSPEVLQYFLVYVRQMKFEETPDYDYLLLLCDRNRGLREVKRMFEVQERERLGEDGGGSRGGRCGSTGNNNTVGPLVGSKRKMRDADMHPNEPVVKKHKVVLPERLKTHQWVIVSTSARTGPSPQMQCYTSHTS